MVRLNNIYRLKHIVRYSNVARIKDENVAEHSFFVASIVLELYNRYSFDIGKALSMALTHDFAEIFVDDVSHQVKRDHPAVAKALSQAEKDVMNINNFSPYVIETVNEYEEASSIEAMIVKYADILQCTQYAKAEMDLGNNGYMVTVYEESKTLAEVYKDKIQKFYKKEGK